MNDAERIGYRWARWADAHPKSAKMIAGSIVLCFGFLMAMLLWNDLTEKPVKTIFRLIVIAFGCGILALISYRTKSDKGGALNDSSVDQDPL